MTKNEIELLADRAAEDGEHSVVGACQVLLSSHEPPEEVRLAEKTVERYLREIRGY